LTGCSPSANTALVPSFDDRFVRELPADPEGANRPRAVFGAAYTRTEPTAVRAPKLLALSEGLAAELGLTRSELESPSWLTVFAGNGVLPGMKPYAACYGGHQFGNWAGQLGDGRALTLGELVVGERRQELQLKGAGPTPYSRTADGRAVLRSSVREFLCSEAMHHLGVPTTRALALVTTGEQIIRDMLYDGNPAPEPGAIVTRVAPSFLRFGNFELPAQRRDQALLRKLADHTITHHFPEIAAPGSDLGPTQYGQWLNEVARRTARMVAHWMRVGFVHGVMNTDNMSVLGLTIDYGPYGWLENYDPNWTPNTTDAQGRRYRFGNQPRIAAWNVDRLAQSLQSLLPQTAREECVEVYGATFESEYRGILAAKLGLEAIDPDEGSADDRLVQELFVLLQDLGLDMTLFFRQLADVPVSASALADASELSVFAWFGDAFYEAPSAQSLSELFTWLRSWAERVRQDSLPDELRRSRMNSHNPKYVLRNWLAQQAIDAAAVGDTSEIARLLEVLSSPYAEQANAEKYSLKRPEWARHRVGCSMLSCSS
jgi:uncharacterized protein YdiU (UPF0061 family)